MDEYREEIVAKLAASVEKVLDAVSIPLGKEKAPNYTSFINAIHSDPELVRALDKSKEEIKKHNITIEELMDFVASKKGITQKSTVNEDGSEEETSIIGNSYVQKKKMKVRNDDFTFNFDNGDLSPLEAVFTDEDITAAWIHTLRDQTIVPSFAGMAASYGMIPDAHVVGVTHVPGVDEHACLQVTSIFSPSARSLSFEKSEEIVKSSMEAANASVEIRNLRSLNLIIVVTTVKSLCVEMRYYRTFDDGKISNTPCFIADNKEDNDDWISKQQAKRDSADGSAKKIRDAIKSAIKSDGGIPVISMDQLREILDEVKEETDPNKAPAKSTHVNRVKFYEN